MVRCEVNPFLPIVVGVKSTDKQRQAKISHVSRALKEARARRGLSMSAVAERAGISQQMVSYVEREMRMPTLDTLLRMSEALEVDLADLLRNAK